MKSSGIGGQAVLEGVMMRNKSEYAVAVRKPDGEIEVKTEKCKSNADRGLFFRLPLVRGILAFVDSLYLGMKTLAYSASFYEEEEPVKPEKNAKKKQNLKKEKAAEGEKDAQKEAEPAETKATRAQDAAKAKSDTREQVEMVLTVVLAVVLALAVFVALPFGLSLLLQGWIRSSALLALIEGVIRVALFIGYVCAISFMEDIHRVFMYHGAEHKTINCVEQCEELTVANVRKQSKQHRRCGTSFLFIVMFISIIFFMFLHFDNMWMRVISRIILIPVVAGISYEFILWAGNSDAKIVRILSTPGMWLQKMTTREPDDAMIEVAIASVEAVFDWKAYQSRVIAMEKSRERKRQKSGKTEKDISKEKDNRKSRAQMAEELRKREEENAKRANERARQIKERERHEAEVIRKADEAAKRHAQRESLNQVVDEMEEDELDHLDHFFDEENSDGETKPSVDSQE